MGCDIHAYIEYKHWGDKWWPFANLDIDRDYQLFGLMAGVRRSDIDPVAQPRGVPSDASWKVNDENELFVSDDPSGGREKPYVSKADAARWLNQGISQQGHSESYITDPDWHTHSWLTIPELRQVIKRYEDGCEQDAPNEVRATLASMLMLCGEDEENARLVFWFDN